MDPRYVLDGHESESELPRPGTLLPLIGRRTGTRPCDRIVLLAVLEKELLLPMILQKRLI